MKVEITKSIRVSGYGDVVPGDIVDVPKSAADVYISRGFAKEVVETVDNEPEKLSAKKVAELIGDCKDAAELKEYESDNRQIAKAAYNKKLKELTQ